MSLVIDESDPCGAAAQLRAVYAKVIAGQSATTISFSAGPTGVSRSATFQPADAGRLLDLIRSYEQQCAAAQGKRPRRFALRSGGTR